MKIRWLLLMVSLSFCLKSVSQDTNSMIQSANELYKQQQFDQAESAYDRVLERDRYNITAKFNLANTYFRRSKKDDAVKAFDYLTSDGRDVNLREKAYYNKGVVLGRQDKLEESIESYKNSLRLNPSDTMARENLQKAMLEPRKKQPPPKKEDEKKKKDQDQQKKQKQQPQPKMNQKEAEQRLKMMEQKEKEVLQRMQSEKSKSANTVAKDW